MTKLLTILLLCGLAAQAQYRSKEFNVSDYGANSADTLDDATAIEATFRAAGYAQGTVIIPSPANYYRVNRTIVVTPIVGNEITVNVISQGTPRKQFKYFGKKGTACFLINGLRFSKWDNISVDLSDTANTIGFDLDTRHTSSSLSFNTFTNCHVVLGNAAGQRGWRIGHTSANGGDISCNQWTTCLVYGQSKTGSTGWQFSGSNTLANVLTNVFTAFLDKGWTNIQDLSAAGTGNGSIYFYSAQSSNNNLDFEIQNTQNITITGGRFESGKAFLKVPWNNKNAVIQVQGLEINDYHPTDGTLVLLESPCALEWRSISVKGRAPWDERMFRLDGGQYGPTAAVGSFSIELGSIETASDSLHTLPGATKWKIYQRGVGKMNTDGVKHSFLKDTQ